MSDPDSAATRDARPARDLSGLTAVVTGGNGGIGLGMGIGLARAGANVAIWARDVRRSEAAAERLTQLGAKAIAVPCDVTDEGNVADAMARTVTELGPLACMIANAGITERKPLTDTSLSQWHAVMRVNLDGAFLCTREAARQFTDHGNGGSIVVVSSMISRYGASRQIAYATSKTGLLGLGRSLAVELAPLGVRCNILVPGMIDTAMSAAVKGHQRFARTITDRTPAGRWGSPDDFEDLAVFLADPRLTFHTGNEVVVDGGYTVF